AELSGVLRHARPREGDRHGRRPSLPQLVHGARRRQAQAADQGRGPEGHLETGRGRGDRAPGAAARRL
ncbi:MAG: Lead, cadmium, zinc and mercury transporting ATPase; Copper-translocating P-type ATPase, partial [uncultured Acidimicrobiales bacterium]